jgi:hypothetical protein
MELLLKVVLFVVLWIVMFRFILKPIFIKLFIRKMYLVNQSPEFRAMLEKYDAKWLSQNAVDSSK